MAALPAQTLQRLADETGRQPTKLDEVLRDLLQEIARDRVLSDRLVLPRGRRRRTRGSVEPNLRGGPPHAAWVQLGEPVDCPQICLIK